MRLSCIIKFKIGFLLPFTGCRKVLEKMPAKVYNIKPINMTKRGCVCPTDSQSTRIELAEFSKGI